MKLLVLFFSVLLTTQAVVARDSQKEVATKPSRHKLDLKLVSRLERARVIDEIEESGVQDFRQVRLPLPEGKERLPLSPELQEAQMKNILRSIMNEQYQSNPHNPAGELRTQ